VIRVIPHTSQRYRTVGDWFYEGSKLVIHVSDTGDWRSDLLVAIHELVEAVLCKDKVPQQVVDTFDMMHPELGEPGDSLMAPYMHEHCFSMAVERMVCAALRYPWATHEELLNRLGD